MAEIVMDYAAVEAMANTFGTSGDMLDGIAQALQVVADVLRATAFIGLVGDAALAHYLDQIAPEVKRLGDKCKELKLDLLGAITSLRDGDASGSQRFAF